MNIDFHTHGKLAKNLDFSEDYTRYLFREASDSELDALCLTEHFNTQEFESLYRFISENYPRHKDTFLVEGVIVFPGMEVDIAEKGHILVIGRLEDILQIHAGLKPFTQKENYLTLSELLELLEEYNLILGGAHPLREGGNLTAARDQDLQRLNFIDLNGKDYAEKGKDGHDELIRFSGMLNLPLLAGSDTHQAFQYGCIYNAFEKDCFTIEELKQSIIEHAYEIKIAGSIQYKVKTAGMLKKALKEINALGGDYVSVCL